jgi:hypothetical protein
MCARGVYMCGRGVYMCARGVYMCARGVDFASVSTIPYKMLELF